ncbi:MAG TPA: AAA family ATPase, partial [Candidatus Angelobacter sp.]|nr:AAA family ATPase [Candidatus Angelobacter sp.]
MRPIITFYSYKGGVGRTMALANIAILLARRGIRVLMVDWDLEAPGLHKYFSQFNTEQSNGGLLDLLIEVSKVRKVPRWNEYTSTISIDNSTTLTMMSAGREKDDYDRRVLEFDWNRFFREQNGGEVLESLRNEWVSEFEAVLIDSRTGITDSGGICTVQMPDILVPVFSPNNQNLEGTKDVVRKAQLARQALAYDRTQLLVFPLLSRFDGRTEYNESQTWLKRSADELREFYLDWLPKDVIPLQIMERTKIPYVAFFSFGEKLPVLTEGAKDPESIGFAYENVAALIANNFQGIDKLLLSPQSILPTIEKAASIPHREWLVRLNRGLQSSDELVATKDIIRIKILLETARGVLIESWQAFQIAGPGLPANIEEWNKEITDFFQHEFLPALNALNNLALQFVRYDAPTDWVSLVID